MDSKALAKQRFLSLVDQVTKELGTERQASLHIGVDPSLAGKVRAEPRRSLGLDLMQKIEKKIGLPIEFFTDPDLGPRPDYRKHLRSAVERDDALSPYPEVEQFIQDETTAGRPIEPEFITELRGLRFYRATVLSPYESAASTLAHLRAKSRGKAVAKQRVRPGG